MTNNILTPNSEMKILIIGPLPPPIDGCSFANKVLKKNLQIRNLKYGAINTNTDVISSDQGSKFSTKKATLFIKNYLGLFKIFFFKVIYFTPGQTFYGVLKYAPFIITCIILGKPYTIHLHGNFLGKEFKNLTGVKRKIFHFLISKASAGIVITKSLATNFDDLLPKKKIFIVEHFVEHTLHQRPLIKKVDKMRILYLSNLMTEKGILEVLDAFIELNNKNVVFEAIIAGSIQVGLEAEVFKRLKILGDNVNYIGVVTGEEKIEKLMEANIFILPTFYKMEGLPFSLLEAMTTGNIIITTAHAGIPDVVTNSNGFIIKQKSSSAIVECLEKINNNLAEMIDKYSLYNRLYSSTNFTEENYTNKILSILHATSKA